MADSNNIYISLAVLSSKRNILQKKKNKIDQDIENIETQKNNELSKIQKQVDDIDKQLLDIDVKINKQRVIAQKQEQQSVKDKSTEEDQLKDTGEVKANPNKLALPDGSPFKEEAAVPAIGSDAATTTASLDASSQSIGGAKPGWKFYNKMGSIQKRHQHDKVEKVHEFVEHIWDSYIVEDIIEGE